MDEVKAPQQSRSPRISVLMSATIAFRGIKVDVKLRNLSETGALIAGELLPPAGTDIVFRKDDFAIGGQVVRVSTGHCGVAFDGKLAPDKFLARVTAKPHPNPPVPGSRRSGLTLRPLSAADRLHGERLGLANCIRAAR